MLIFELLVSLVLCETASVARSEARVKKIFVIIYSLRFNDFFNLPFKDILLTNLN